MAIWKTKSKMKGLRYKPMVESAPGKWMRSRTHDRLIDARQEERELLRLRNMGKGDGLFVPLPFSKAAQRWFEDCKRRGCSYGHISLIEQHIRTHLLPFFGDSDIKKIRTSDISAFVEYLRKKKLANITINGILTALKSLFSFLREEDDMESCPIKRKHRLPKIHINQKPVWTKDEAERFLSYAEQKYHGEKRWIYLFYKIALNTGMRYGEVLALEKADIDFERNRILISKSFCSSSGGIKTPKNNHTRYAPLPLKLAEEIKEYLVTRQIFGPLFTNANGEYQSYNSFRDIYLRDMKEAGARVTKFHNLRRTFITLYVEQHGSESMLRKMVGHATESMTDLYVVQRDDLKDIATLVNL